MSAKVKRIVYPAVSLLLAVAVSWLIMFLSGYDPYVAFSILLRGAFGSGQAISNTLIQATPLIFTGLAYMVGKKATMINLGVEGQLYIGAMAGALLGQLDFPLPGIFHLLLVMAGGCIAGGLAGLFIGWLKVRFGSNEVITTTMTNFILINFTGYLANYPLKAPGATAQTNRMVDAALFPKLFSNYRLTWAIVVGLLVAVFVKFLIDETRFGFEVKAVGLSLKASETAGIRVGKVIMTAMFVSGAVAGPAGSVQMMSVNRRFVAGFSADYGFSGIAVAALGNDSAFGIVLSGLIFGILRNGADYLNMSSRIPTEFVDVIQALVVIFVSAPLLIQGLLSHFTKKEE